MKPFIQEPENLEYVQKKGIAVISAENTVGHIPKTSASG